MHARWLSTECPHRLPQEKDYKTAVKTASATQRVHRNPLTAIEILARRNPEAFIEYVYALYTRISEIIAVLTRSARYPSLLHPETDSEKPHDRFECAIATPWTLLLTIIQASDFGIYMDSSWRNKNAFRCPLTFLVTLNKYHRMIPRKSSSSDMA